MERPRKSGKSQSLFGGSDFIPLGKSKTSTATPTAGGSQSSLNTPEPELRKPSSIKMGYSTSKISGNSSTSTSERKRESGTTQGISLPSKKPKLLPQSALSTFSPDNNSALPLPTSAEFTKPDAKTQKKDVEDFLNKLDTMELTGTKYLQVLEKAEELGDSAALEDIILGSLKKLRQLKEKPDISLCEALLLTARDRTEVFRSQAGIDALIALAKTKRSGIDVKTKPGQQFAILTAPLAVNMMLSSHESVEAWPVSFVQVWLEDACQDRSWVDRPECSNFVDSLLSSFETISPSRDLLLSLDQPMATPSGGSSPALLTEGEAGFQEELARMIQENLRDIEELNRYSSSTVKEIETMLVDYAKEMIQKRSPEIPKNLFRTLGSICGLPEIRSFLISRIEQWLHNPKCSRHAQELLIQLCVNAKSYKTPSAEGGHYIVQMCKLRMKTKQLTQLYSVAVREMVRGDELNLKNVLIQLVYNELSLQRNPANYPVLGAILSAYPEARSELAVIFMELLQKKDDFIVGLRQILRDSMRACRHDCNLSDFVFGLLNVREFSFPDGTEFRGRVFRNVVDLIGFSLFLSFTPTVKEATASKTEKNIGILTNFCNQVAKVQEEALSWLYSVAIKLYRPTKVDYVAALHKFLLKDPAADLNYKENWPTESDRNMFTRQCNEIPLLEPSFMWILFQAFSKEHNYFTAAEILDATETAVMKAALHGARIEISKVDLIDSLFRLAEYRHPENIALPIGYSPPKLGITKSCWRVWVMLLVLASHNPTIIGRKGWDSLPTLRVLMEMCMTNHFTYPTLASSETLDEIISRELQISAIEKEQILEFETHLAAGSTKATITEKSSILLSQLITLEPYGKPRTPPPWVTPHLKTLNDQLRMGYRFCRSRNPDFLVDLMQRNSESMPWLSELVTEGSFEILPVRSLCEYFLAQTDRIVKMHNTEVEDLNTGSVGDKSPRKMHKSTENFKEDAKSVQLMHYLQTAVQKNSEDSATEILEFFFRRLSFPKSQNRIQGIQGLQLLFSTPKRPLTNEWLSETIPALPLFSDIQDILTKCLRKAIQIENEPSWLARYLEFLSVWATTSSDTITDNLALDVTQLVVERSIVIQSLLTHKPEVYDSLFDIYLNHMKRVRGPGRDSHQWSDSIEQVLVRWENAGVEANMSINIVHAIVILLSSYSESSEENFDSKRLKAKGSKGVTELRYQELMEMWFPKQAELAPRGLLLSTLDEAILFPDWIKLRMIRSNNPRLLAAASDDLDIDQLVLFVQSFGIPVKSMTGLLYCLDKASEEKPQRVTEAILDPKYIKTIVEVQWKRGAKGGEKFAHLVHQLVGVEDETFERFTTPNRYNSRPVLDLSEVKSVFREESLPTRQHYNTPAPISIVTQKRLSQRASTERHFEEPMDISSNKDLNIRNLSKQLFVLSFPAAKRRSSAPVVDETTLNHVPRRYSMTQDSHLDQSGKESFKLQTTVGQLVDTMCEVEPCIVKNALDVQLPLLFGRSEAPPHCRAFLMTELTHEAGWKTVEECLNLFLTEFSSSFDATAVLDLISSTISNPKLGQGCEKHVPKHQRQLPVFNLKTSELLVMAEYIIEEIGQIEMKSTKFSITNLLGSTESSDAARIGKRAKHCLQDRVSLWLVCCRRDKDVIDTIMNLLTAKKCRNPCAKKFFSQIYMEFPQVTLMDVWKGKSGELGSNSEGNVNCVLDLVSHVLINVVGNVKPEKEWAKKVTHEFELCLRKLASYHPTLLLRQLPLMGVLLEGRVHLDFQVFHSQNHHIPFKVFLGLFVLMEPDVTKEFKILKPILALYMQLFENFGHLKDYSTSLTRYSVLLHNLLQAHPLEMSEFLGNNYTTLKDLSTETYYLEVGPLQNLITSLVPPSSGSEMSILTQSSSEMDPLTMNAKQSDDIYNRFLNASNNDEIASALQELDSLAIRNPAVLHQFSDILNSFLLSDFENCRATSFNLILRHMTYSPSSSKLYLKRILQALRSGGGRSIENFIERIPEFIILAQENADLILSQLFDLGLETSTVILPTIAKTLNLLRSQSGQYDTTV